MESRHHLAIGLEVLLASLAAPPAEVNSGASAP
jgi:hypothetical protein